MSGEDDFADTEGESGGQAEVKVDVDKEDNLQCFRLVNRHIDLYELYPLDVEPLRKAVYTKPNHRAFFFIRKIEL